MTRDNEFTGMGKNLHGPDLPLGFGMSLAQHPEALNAYGRLSDKEKSSVIAYIQGGKTGSEAKNRIEDAVEKLEHGGAGTGFF